jgi:hypothetical protein
MILRRWLGPEHASDPYPLLGFDVPEGTRRLEVSYRYDRAGGAVIDLGAVDPRGAAFPRFPGFRGWSGGFREGFVITEGGATPGYLPGPIQPGRWAVLLGLYKIPDAGVDVEVEITLGRDPGTPPHPLPAPPSPPLSRPEGWFRGELHSHTHHSDAPGSLDALIEEARERGLDFLAVTDHNTGSHLPHLAHCPPDLLLVPGIEVTTYRGHLNAWGVEAPVDFRCRTAQDITAVIETVHEQGGVCSASHPVCPGLEWSYGYDIPVDGMEVWHGPTGPFNAVTHREWDDLLRSGRRLTAFGGSDHHIGNDDIFAQPTVWVRAKELRVPALIEGLRGGHVALSAQGLSPVELEVRHGSRIYGPGDTAPAERVHVRCTGGLRGYEVRLMSALGQVSEGELDLARHRYVRAEMCSKGDMPFPLVAMTNPVWAAG